MVSNSSKWLLPNYTEEARGVVEFNSVLGHPKTKAEVDQRIQIQENLIDEEIEELITAYEQGDKAGFLKEACDVFVVLSYRLWLHKGDSCFNDDTFIVASQFGSSVRMIINAVADYVHEGDWVTSTKAIIALLNIIDCNSKEALKAVNRNNMSKFQGYVPTSEEEYDTETRLIESNSDDRYADIVWEKRGDYVVFVDSVGKIMKPTNYKTLSVEEYVN